MVNPFDKNLALTLKLQSHLLPSLLKCDGGRSNMPIALRGFRKSHCMLVGKGSDNFTALSKQYTTGVNSHFSSLPITTQFYAFAHINFSMWQRTGLRSAGLLGTSHFRTLAIRSYFFLKQSFLSASVSIVWCPLISLDLTKAHKK